MIRQAQTYFAAAVSAAALNAAAIAAAFVLLTVLPSLHGWSLSGLIGSNDRVTTAADPSASPNTTRALPNGGRLPAHARARAGSSRSAGAAAPQDPARVRSHPNSDPSPSGTRGASIPGGGASGGPTSAVPNLPSSAPSAPSKPATGNDSPSSQSTVHDTVTGAGAAVNDTVGSGGSSGSGSGSGSTGGAVQDVTGTVQDTTDKLLGPGSTGGGAVDGVGNTLSGLG
jgi:hypothetical protein